jgi:hypothetical protein
MAPIPPLSRGTACPRGVPTREGEPVATTNDLKNGLVLNLDGQLWAVVEFQHVKPARAAPSCAPS